MQIQLNDDLPVEAKHGCTKGRVFDAKDSGLEGRGVVRWWVIGDVGERVGVRRTEAEIVKSDD